jgi:hypothetical protein
MSKNKSNGEFFIKLCEDEMAKIIIRGEKGTDPDHLAFATVILKDTKDFEK